MKTYPIDPDIGKYRGCGLAVAVLDHGSVIDLIYIDGFLDAIRSAEKTLEERNPQELDILPGMISAWEFTEAETPSEFRIMATGE